MPYPSRPPGASPYPVLLVSCILCRRLHRAARGLATHPVCPACQRFAKR
jgi:hypothetical protein